MGIYVVLPWEGRFIKLGGKARQTRREYFRRLQSEKENIYQNNYVITNAPNQPKRDKQHANLIVGTWSSPIRTGTAHHFVLLYPLLWQGTIENSP
jgi:hypothetical protein